MTTPDAAHTAALALLGQVPLVDGHNDLPWVLRQSGGLKDLAGYDLTRLHPETDTDIPRLKAGRLGAQVLAAFLPGTVAHPATVTLEQIDLILRIEEMHGDVFLPARGPADVVRAHQAGKIGSIISVEGTVGCEGSLAPLRLWQKLGVRLVTLCHNETLPWVDSATDAPSGQHGGLSDFGVSLVQEMNRLGLIIDIAHVAPHAMHKVLDASRAPVMDTHCCAMSLCPHPRNIPDDVLARMKDTGSLVLVTFVPTFLSPESLNAEKPYKDEYWRLRKGADSGAMRAAAKASMAAWPHDGIALICDHLAYFRDRVGEDCIGFGSDFFGSVNPTGMEDVSRFPALIAELIRRGWSEPQLRKVMSGNFLRVWEKIQSLAG